MTAFSKWNEMRLETPATYRIRVQGIIGANWKDRFGGMQVTEESSSGTSIVTVLTGHLPDQAALSGVLNTLYDLHLPLLSVENLDEKQG
jgi:hypothetical protein